MVEFVVNMELFYERRILPVSNRKPKSVPASVVPKSKTDTYKTIVLYIVAPLTVIFIPAVIAFAITASGNMATLNTRLNDMDTAAQSRDTRIGKIESDIGDIKDQVGNLNTKIAVIENNIGNMTADIGDIKKAFSSAEPASYKFVYPKENFQEAVFFNFKGDSTFTLAMETDSLEFSRDTVVGTDENGGDITFGELEDVPFCMNYFEKGVDTWLYGKLNERGNWDGCCIMNDYVGDELIAIFESKYNNGIREGEFKSVQRENREEREYIFNNRTYHGSYSTGETFKYKNVEWPDIYFKSDKPMRYDDCNLGNLISYYYGEISNHFYNDGTGRAVNIQYNEDGTVRLFYQGNFSNGNYVDDRQYDSDKSTADNTAFWIILADDGSQYLYHMGPFVNGHPKNKDWYKHENAKIPINDNPADKLPNPGDYSELKWKIWQANI